MHKIHLIPEEHATTKSTIFERGKKGSTKYFLIPKCLRDDIEIKKEAYCLRSENKDKIIWTYFMDKGA